MVPTVKCDVCTEKEAKYKCPVCRAPYCSVACCKTHKESSSCKSTPCSHSNSAKRIHSNIKSESSAPLNFPTIDTVPPEKLALLGNSAELRAVLGNPHLQAMLKGVDSASNARNVMDAAMQEPIFTEFVDICMQIIDPDKTKNDE